MAKSVASSVWQLKRSGVAAKNYRHMAATCGVAWREENSIIEITAAKSWRHGGNQRVAHGGMCEMYRSAIKRRGDGMRGKQQAAAWQSAKAASIAYQRHGKRIAAQRRNIIARDANGMRCIKRWHSGGMAAANGNRTCAR